MSPATRRYRRFLPGRCGGRGRGLLRWFGGRPGLRVADEALDEVHVLCDKRAVDAVLLELLHECEPGRIDVIRDESLLSIVSHVRDVSEGAFFRT